MSSHHVVRDNQEPALVLYQLRFEDYPIVMNLMEWSPFVVLHENAFDVVKDWGIKYDLLVSSNSTSVMEEYFVDQQPFETLIGDIESIQQRLSSKNHRMVNYFGTPEGVLNDNWSDFEITCFHEGSQYTRFEKKFSKWLPKNTTIAFIGDTKTKGVFNGLTQIDGIVEAESEGVFWVKEEW